MSPYTTERKSKKYKSKPKKYDSMVHIPKRFKKYMQDWINNLKLTSTNSLWMCVMSMKGKDWWINLLCSHAFMDNEVMNPTFTPSHVFVMV